MMSAKMALKHSTKPLENLEPCRLNARCRNVMGAALDSFPGRPYVPRSFLYNLVQVVEYAGPPTHPPTL